MQGVLLFASKAKINVFLNYFRGNRTSCNHSYTVVALFFHFQGNVQLPKMKCYYYFFRMSIGSPRGGFSKYIFKKFTQPPCDKQLICKTTSNPEKLFPNLEKKFFLQHHTRCSGCHEASLSQQYNFRILDYFGPAIYDTAKCKCLIKTDF